VDHDSPTPDEVGRDPDPAPRRGFTLRGHSKRRVALGAGVSIAAAFASIVIAIPLGASGGSRSAAPVPAATPTAPAVTATSTGVPEPPPAPDAVSESMGAAPATGTGRDPLVPAETDAARRIALDAGLRTSGRDVSGAPGPEALSVDISEPLAGEEDSTTAPRRADVYFYDYTDNTLVKQVVNLTTGKVERTARAGDMQPPPSLTETATALRLLLDSAAGADLKAAYRAATGRTLTGTDQLSANGSSYLTSPGDKRTPQCGRDRCLILFVKAKDGPYLDTTRTVIDLSARTVIPPA